MSDVFRLLSKIETGDPSAAEELLPLVYDELRKLAASRMASEAPDHSLTATALVHEAYLRLVGDQHFDGRGHFFAAAAEAMRRVLVESARRRGAAKRGGGQIRVELSEELIAGSFDADILGVDEVIDQLMEVDARAAKLVKLHAFAGLTIEQAGETLGISARVAYRDWSFARAWMFRRLAENEKNPN